MANRLRMRMRTRVVRADVIFVTLQRSHVHYALSDNKAPTEEDALNDPRCFVFKVWVFVIAATQRIYENMPTMP